MISTPENVKFNKLSHGEISTRHADHKLIIEGFRRLRDNDRENEHHESPEEVQGEE